MKRHFVCIVLCVFVIGDLMAQSECKVKLEAISASYEGVCKKGYAEGIGEAKGEQDSYKGIFKKGYPHGKGTYTWGNGNSYIGSFVKGKMDGKGILSIKKSEDKTEVKNGYFKKNEYIGKFKTPYRVITQREVKKVFIQADPSKLAGESNEIKIMVKHNGHFVLPQMTIIDENRSTIQRRDRMMVLTNVQFPTKKIEVSFEYAGFSSRVVLDVYNKGNWIVEISI